MLVSTQVLSHIFNIFFKILKILISLLKAATLALLVTTNYLFQASLCEAQIDKMLITHSVSISIQEKLIFLVFSGIGFYIFNRKFKPFVEKILFCSAEIIASYCERNYRSLVAAWQALIDK